ncbi:MAG TPA: fused MFS/spermidine synthase, partial [Gemmataceae bacterium]|nr:fused MFS/spermidine synthase [Gemmataceae bacterium]
MPILFATTMFVSATLLFWVEPMIAKMILPRLGGTPAVWNCCLVFFQTVLLAGYAYAHLSTSKLGIRRQSWVHVLVVLLPLAFLPLGLRDWAPPTSGNPLGWLLLLLAASVGLPFFVLSTTAPLLQKWYSNTGGPAGNDPYFLYAASNFGSLLALLGYPVLIEPFLPLRGTSALFSQVNLWAIGYGCYCVLLFTCLVGLNRTRSLPDSAQAVARQLAKRPMKVEPPEAARLPLPACVRWVCLAFVPSSLLLGITTFITQDIAAIPLLWVIPLSLYLLSFILVFARWPERCHRLVVLVTPLLIVSILFIAESGLEPGIILSIGLHLLTLFVVALACHGELARGRPPVAHLTAFYLLIALGGVLGGLFNALLAPVLFSSVIEHEVALALACLLLPAFTPVAPLFLERRFGWPPSRMRAWCVDVIIAVLLGVISLDLLVFYAREVAAADSSTSTLFAVAQRALDIAATALHVSVDTLWKACLYGVPLLICLGFQRRSVRFGLALAAFIVASRLNGPLQEQGKDLPTVLYRDRSFFSVLRIELEGKDTIAESHILMHGTTLHGQQFTDPRLRREPLTYYTKSGPLGQMMRIIDGSKAHKKFALIGLGAGTSACYGRSGDALTCYEIDNAVVKIAKDTRYFTYLSDCAARGCQIEAILGDARLRLAEAPDRAFDVIIVDAFSSDAVPIHLITRQAFELYLQKLTPDGVLLIHVSNHYLNLDPVVGNNAHS